MILSDPQRWIPLEWIRSDKSYSISNCLTCPLLYRLYSSRLFQKSSPQIVISGLFYVLPVFPLSSFNNLSYSSNCSFDFYSYCLATYQILGFFFALILCISTLVPLYFIFTLTTSNLKSLYCLQPLRFCTSPKDSSKLSVP